jgi:uncharacterized protein YdeI (YjbR/CyaY-like superfamily)
MRFQKELDELLAANPVARQIFDQLPPSHQREYDDWIAQAKKADTRTRRANKAIDMILQDDVKQKRSTI